MYIFIFKTGIRNVWRQKLRFGGVGICIFLFTIALLNVSELSLAIENKIDETENVIAEIDYESTVHGSGEWRAEQSGDVIKNMSNPLLIAKVCIQLLSLFLWMAAFVLTFSIFYMILLERISELSLYHLLGLTLKGVSLLLYVEVFVVAVVFSAVSYGVGQVLLKIDREIIWGTFGLQYPYNFSIHHYLNQYFLVYLTAMSCAIIFFIIKEVKHKKISITREPCDGERYLYEKNRKE